MCSTHVGEIIDMINEKGVDFQSLPVAVSMDEPYVKEAWLYICSNDSFSKTWAGSPSIQTVYTAMLVVDLWVDSVQ